MLHSVNTVEVEVALLVLNKLFITYFNISCNDDVRIVSYSLSDIVVSSSSLVHNTASLSHYTGMYFNEIISSYYYTTQGYVVDSL